MTADEVTAYHEAGHAVIALMLGGEIGHVTIAPDRDDGPTRFGDMQVLWPRGQWPRSELLERTARVALAGPAAESAYQGQQLHPGFVPEWADDWRLAWNAAAELERNERARLRLLERWASEAHACMEREPVWAAVAAIADELLAHEWLEAEQVRDAAAFWLR